MEFILAIAVIILFAQLVSLKGRLKRIESHVGIKSDYREATPSTSQQSPVSAPSETQTAEPAVQTIEYASVDRYAVERFIEWVKEDWLLKLGALLLLIGFGWLTSYAFLHNWIGPMGRISLGIIAGVLILLLGWVRIKDYRHQGSIFLVLGSTVILLTIFAARDLYGFFTPLSALVLMFLSTAFVGLASVRFKTRWLALASLILAGIAPLLTNSPRTDYLSLLSYLLVVILGAIWIVAITKQRELTAAALILVSIYSIPHWVGFTNIDTDIFLVFAYIFAAVFFITNTLGLLKLKGKDIIPDLVTAAGNGLFLLIWITVAVPDEWQSLVIAAWMIVFSLGAFMVFNVTKRREPFYIYAGVGVAMLAAATAAELQGAVLTIAFTIEAAAVSLTAYVILRDLRIAQFSSFLLLIPMLMAVRSMDSWGWRSGVLNENFFVLLVLGLTLLGLGIFFWLENKEAQHRDEATFNAALMIAGSVYLYILLWLFLHAGIKNYDTATMISFITYTIVGLIVHFYGLFNNLKALRTYGAILLGLVVARLLIVDIWDMELAGRIVTFFVVGALLMSTAFIGKRQLASLPDHKYTNPED